MQLLKIFILLFAMRFYPVRAKEFEAKSRTVRVLSWWGYIDPKNQEVAAIEKKCRAKLSIDEFYSTTEFLARISSHRAAETNYDVVIYSDTAYNTKESSFVRNSRGKLDLLSSEYASPISAYFKKSKYNNATRIFQLSLAGFLVNREKVNFRNQETLDEIFKITGDNLFVLMDDHLEVSTLLRKWDCIDRMIDCKPKERLSFPSEGRLRKLIGQSKLVVSSDLAEITRHPKFGIAYTWSGDAIQKQNSQKNLDFFLHPSLSHSSMDLLTLTGNSEEAKCVAHNFSSKDFIEQVSRKSRYFSPYGPIISEDRAFTNMQREFFDQFQNLGRIQKVTQEESLEIDKKWQLFKIVFGSKI